MLHVGDEENQVLNRLDRARLRKIGMRNDDFDIYRFGDEVPLAEAHTYLGYDLFKHQVRPALNAWGMHALTENKWIFYRLMDSFGLPVPETFGLYHAAFGLTWDGDPLVTADAVLALLDHHRPPAIVLKPAGGEQGTDVRIVRDIDHDAGTCRTAFGPARLADVVASVPPDEQAGTYHGTIVQRLVDQHPDMARLNPDAPNTIRVITLVTDSTVIVQRAVAKIGRAGVALDAWSLGGTVAAIDPATGIMGPGLTRPEHGRRRVSRHPGTGAPIEGVAVPLWDEVVDVCTRAARVLPRSRSLGWDVLITADGPVLIEGNRGWNLHMSQVHGPGLLADPEFRQAVEAAGVVVPSGVPRNPLTRALPRQVARRLLRQARRRL
jgi:hypothetical protein